MLDLGEGITRIPFDWPVIGIVMGDGFAIAVRLVIAQGLLRSGMMMLSFR